MPRRSPPLCCSRRGHSAAQLLAAGPDVPRQIPPRHNTVKEGALAVRTAAAVVNAARRWHIRGAHHPAGLKTVLGGGLGERGVKLHCGVGTTISTAGELRAS